MTVYQYQTAAPQSSGSDSITPAPQVRLDGEAGLTSRVTFRDGVPVSETSGVSKFSASELNPYHDSGTVFATATNHGSIGLQAVTADSLITINGVQAKVSFFEREGMVHRAADGSYAEGSGRAEAPSQAAPEANTQDELSMPQEIATAVDTVLADVADHHIAPLMATSLGMATGQLDRGRLVEQMAQYTGTSPAEAEGRVAFVQAAYQQQADAALTARGGVEAADLQDFYAWAKEAQPGALRGAVEKQLQSGDFSGYRSLAEKYFMANPPSMNAVKDAGFEVRQAGLLPEVRMHGQWFTIATAARLGML